MCNDIKDQCTQLDSWLDSLPQSNLETDTSAAGYQRPPNPHDQFFRKMMTDRKIAQGFLHQYLPSEIVAAIDWKYLKLQPSTFVSNWWKDLVSDLIYQVKFRGYDSYLVLLIEHQSTPDKMLPYRVERYKHQFLEQFIAQNPNVNLPMIYPLVLYNGAKKYHYPTDIRNLIAAPREIIEVFYEQPLVLIDLSTIDDEKLQQDSRLALLLITMKYIHTTDQDEVVRKVLKSCHKAYNSTQKNLIKFVIEYLLIAGDVEDEAKFNKIVSEELSKTEGDSAMSLGQRLIDRGVHQGLQQGMQLGEQKGRQTLMHEIAANMRHAGYNSEQIKQITGLEIDDLD